MDTLTLLVGTANPHKLAEIDAILAGLPVRVVGAAVLPRPVAIEETGATFEENARLKAVAFARAACAIAGADRPRWVISDDSGLCVDAIGGAPGVLSARYAGPQHDDGANNRKLLEALAGVPTERRGAAFVCAIACVEVPAGDREPKILFEARGECRGVIAEAPRGTGGFGYDPLFVIPGTGKTYAELSEEEKNRISHRGRALKRFAELFRPVLDAALRPRATRKKA
jgi:XTP/dITP diphosphohydrolase